jgi:cytosine deaminase
MALDLIISNARLAGWDVPVDIGIADGHIVEIAPSISADAPRDDAGGALAFAGFVEGHIHLDKAGILERCPICEGTLKEAVGLTAKAKAGFTISDVRERAAKVVEAAILHGTTRLRSFVEIDPRAGFRSFEALLEVQRDYASSIDIELCAFAQEGLTQEMATHAMLDDALGSGATLIGGCPYTDPDPVAHVGLIFDLAEKHGTAVDFHADFDLDPNNSILPEVARQTRDRGFEGRVSVGHATKLAAMSPAAVDRLGADLASAGITITALPATDLFILGSFAPLKRLKELGVEVTLATNNILNPFTPYGDASLLRMANLYANTAHLARDEDLAAAFEMITAAPARQLGAPYGIAIGAPADIVLLDAPDAVTAVRTNAPTLSGYKRGRKTFIRPRAALLQVPPAAR